MKKKLLVILMAVLMVAAFAGCGSAQAGDIFIEEGKIKVGLEPEYPPMEFKDDNGNLTGFDVELMTEIAKRMGVEVEFVETGWDGIFMGLDAGTYDVVCSGVSITNDRLKENKMIFTDPYMNNGQYIIVPKGVTDINQPEDLAGKKVGVQFATTSDEACIKHLETVQFDLQKYDTVQQAFMALEAGHIDVVVTDASVAIAFVNENAEKFDISTAKLTNEPMAIAARVGNDKLVEELNKVLDEMRADGTLKTLSEKYIGTDATNDIDTVIK